MSLNRKSGDAAVVLKQIVKQYSPGSPAAVDNISLQFDSGCLTTLLGPSGCGKTTTLRMIAGLEMATSGQILIGGVDVTRLPATQRDVSMVFQSYALFPHMRVFENIRYGLEVGSLKAEEIDERVDAIMRMTGLEALGSRYPHELSGGQQQRVAVARALVIEPQVLLFDEPLSNLDAKLRRKVRQEIRDLQQSLGLTVIYVTHDQEEALAISDTIVVLNNAVVAQLGSPRELYEKPRTQFVADFIGEANILPCERVASAHGVKVVAGPLRFELSEAIDRVGKGHMAVNPGKISLQPHQEGALSPHAMTGMLSKASYLGDHLECVVETAIGEILVRTPVVSDAPFAGSVVTVTIPPEAIVLLDD